MSGDYSRHAGSPACNQPLRQPREVLLSEHLPLVRFIAMRIHARSPRHLPLEDLVNAGVLGLIDAAHKFDPRKHVQFGTYASHRIRGAILDGMRELDWSPRELRHQARQVEDACTRLQNKLGRRPAENELARELQLSISELHTLLSDLNRLKVESLISEQSLSAELNECCELPIKSDRYDPFHDCLMSETKTLLMQAVSQLAEKERQVLLLYYFRELTMKQIGVALGVGESRISQIHALALAKLKSRMSELTSGKEPGFEEQRPKRYTSLPPRN